MIYYFIQFITMQLKVKIEVVYIVKNNLHFFFLKFDSLFKIDYFINNYDEYNYFLLITLTSFFIKKQQIYVNNDNQCILNITSFFFLSSHHEPSFCS